MTALYEYFFCFENTGERSALGAGNKEKTDLIVNDYE